ncbi:uncharacterized protein [Littorina saxatilis]|uniref:uncharacterized protein isoform X1 n=1 Tax=Littorina saxatilis TaxID=31220 RepID=UPI0038B42CAC
MPPKRRAASATAKLMRTTRGPIRAPAPPGDDVPLGAGQEPAAPQAAAPDPALVQAVTQAVLQALAAQAPAAELSEDPVINVIDDAVADMTGCPHSRQRQHLGRPAVPSASGQVQAISSLGRSLQPSAGTSAALLEPLTSTLSLLLKSSLAPSTQTSYRRAWTLFVEFADKHCLAKAPHIPVGTIALFISFLTNKSYKPATISSYVSALGYIHKMYAVPDPTSSFMIQKLLQAGHKRTPAHDSRLPLSKKLLIQLLDSLTHIVVSPFDKALYSAMFSLAFHAFLRVGEITVRNRQDPNPHLISSQKVALSNGKITLKFLSFKHSCGRAFTLTIQPGSSACHCPVALLSAYLQLCCPGNSPLFACASGRPVLREEFETVLKRALVFCQVDPSHYHSHSFRIGAATAAAERGLSDAQIRQLGRWKSDAFKTYIRSSWRSSAL